MTFGIRSAIFTPYQIYSDFFLLYPIEVILERVFRFKMLLLLEHRFKLFLLNTYVYNAVKEKYKPGNTHEAL